MRNYEKLWTVNCQSARQQLLNLYPQIDRSEGFGHERVGSALGGTIGHLGLSVGGEHEDLDLCGVRVRSKSAEDLPTIEPRKPDIKHYNGWLCFVDLFESGDTVHRTRDVNIEYPQAHFDQPSDRR